MSDRSGTVERLAIEIGNAFGRLGYQLRGQNLIETFAAMGVRFPSDLFSVEPITTSATNVADIAAAITGDVASLQALIDSEDSEVADIIAAGETILEQIVALVGALGDFTQALEDFGPGLPGMTQARIAELVAGLPRKLLDRMLLEQMNMRPSVRHTLTFLGIVTETFHDEIPGDEAAPAFTERKIEFGNLFRLLGSPEAYFRDLYQWGEPAPIFDGQALFEAIEKLVAGLAMPVHFEPATATDPARLELLAVDVTVDNQSPPGLVISAVLPIGGDVEITPESPHPLWQFQLGFDGRLDLGAIGRLRPPLSLSFDAAGASGLGEVTVTAHSDPEVPIVLLGTAGASRLEVAGIDLSFGLVFRADASGAKADLELGGRLQKGHIIVQAGEDDGFLSSLLDGHDAEAHFDLDFAWSAQRGLTLRGLALELDLPVSFSIGPITVTGVHLGLDLAGTPVVVELSTSVSGKLGPITATVDRMGALTKLTFPPGGDGNLGPVDLEVDFKPPSGVGIAVDAGPISGGGFLDFRDGRYSGAVELTIYSVSVKAFGLIETKRPDGSPGFSFVIVISAEFPGIQLGFGFTLLGVGGIIGINRGLDANELGRLVLAGESGHLLFPKDVVANAPAIIRDLGTVFPAREGRYVFGPLAKLGWGTPTLIRGELGLILELPGPTLTILGEVRVRLPKEELALASFNLSVLGFLDFPRKSFGLDAALHDSIINGYPVSGQMAMRVRWGEEPNFVLSVGGFHPAYKPPPGFPKLQPLTLDLGKSDDVSVTVSGFFAVTSNTLQIGGDARLHASGSGISLDATLGVKALFIFTPFSFEAIIDASVKISFHGRGPSVHLHGVLSGPTPWRARGELCVSILFWDACLGFDETFGGGEPQSVPAIDPWTGSAGPPEVMGLKQALDDPASWSTEPPPGALSVVTLAEGSKNLVDPLGVLIVRERIVPVETAVPIERFGVAKVPAPITFKLLSATLQGSVPLVKRGTVEDSFAPAQYFELDDAKKLSAKSYEKREAGYRLAANDRDLQLGSKVSFEPAFETLVIAADGTATSAAPYVPTEAHVDGSTTRSAVALFGTLQLGTRRYIDPRFTRLFALPAPTFQLAHVANLFGSSTAPPPASRTEALLLYAAFIRAQPEQRVRFQVVASHEIRGI